MTDNQLYSKAMTELKGMEKMVKQESTIEQKVNYTLLVVRVYRLSNKMGDAMDMLNTLPNLDKYPRLKLKVEFRRAALYSEGGNYTIEEQIKLVHPIIDQGIKTAKEIKDFDDLASFYSLKASMHSDECRYLNRNCVKNYEIARDYYKKAMQLFNKVKDTLNYHNVLNGLFRLELLDNTQKVDSLKILVENLTERSTYSPNIITSRALLAHYYILVKKDTIRQLQEMLKGQGANVDMVNKNADNAINKMKLLYEFDSLTTSIKHSKNLLDKQNTVIDEKNKSITQTVIFSVILVLLLAVLTYLFVRQRKLTQQVFETNGELKLSNNNYELLIKESNHRIKNNLQMILSMLELDKSQLDKGESDLLNRVSAKISTITALHRLLDFKEHNQKVMLRNYFDEIISYYSDLTKQKQDFTLEITNLEMESERIIYFGLLLNEMISNTLKHRRLEGDILIQVVSFEKKYIFTYRDNSNFESFTKGNGVKLIEGLIRRFGGTDFIFNPVLGEYKFYFNE